MARRPPTRRAVLRGLGAAAGGAVVGSGALLGCPTAAPPWTAARRLVFVAVDGVHPAYLELDAAGDGPGGAGDWLMPRLRAFLEDSVWYPDARAFLPAATDMNHPPRGQLVRQPVLA